MAQAEPAVEQVTVAHKGETQGRVRAARSQFLKEEFRTGWDGHVTTDVSKTRASFLSAQAPAFMVNVSEAGGEELLKLMIQSSGGSQIDVLSDQWKGAPEKPGSIEILNAALQKWVEKAPFAKAAMQAAVGKAAGNKSRSDWDHPSIKYRAVCKAYDAEVGGLENRDAVSQHQLQEILGQAPLLKAMMQGNQLILNDSEGTPYNVTSMTDPALVCRQCEAELGMISVIERRGGFEKSVSGDLEKIPNEERLLAAARSHPVCSAFDCWSSSLQEQLNAVKKFGGLPWDLAKTGAENSEAGFFGSLARAYRLWATHRQKTTESAVGEGEQNQPGLYGMPPAKEAPTEVTQVTRSATGVKGCITHATGGKDGKGCPKGHLCKKSHHQKMGSVKWLPPGKRAGRGKGRGTGGGGRDKRESDRPPKKKTKFTGKCFRCNKSGHRISDCPEKEEPAVNAIDTIDTKALIADTIAATIAATKATADDPAAPPRRP